MCATVLAGFGCRASPALAQAGAGQAAGQSVLGRARPEYDPIGLRVGTFTLLPSIEASAGYDSNVRALPRPVDDAILALRPVLLARSNWSRNAVTLNASGDIQRFADRPIENAAQYRIGANGRFDIGGRTHIVTDARAARQIEPRGSTGDTSLNGPPVAFMNYHVAVGADHDFGPVQTRGNLTVDAFRYGDRTVATGSVVDGSGRNYQSILGDLQATFPVSSAAGAFIRGTINTATYTNEGAGPSGDSKSFSGLTGIAFGITPLLYGSVGIGYLGQTYSDRSLKGTSGLDYDAAITWNPTPLVTGSVTLNRSLQRAPSATLGAITVTTGTLTIDYELRRNLLLGVTAVYTHNRFGLIDRTQDQVIASARATYLFNRTLSSTLRLNHVRSRPDQASGIDTVGIGRRFDRTQVTLGVRVQL